MEYEKQVKALRCCAGENTPGTKCPFYDEYWCGNECLDKRLKDAATSIEELMAQVKDKDYLIQQQTEEIQRLQRDVKKQQEKMIELAKGLYKTGVFTADGREIIKGDKVKGLFLYAQPVTGTVIFRDGSFGLEWDRGGALEFTPFTSTCNVKWEIVTEPPKEVQDGK